MIPIFLSFGFFILYVWMQITSIYAGDSGKLVAAAYTWSIAHPPGYPLYCFLGGILSHLIPFNTVAWRVGLLSSLPMALSMYFIWKIVFLISKSKVGSTVAGILFGLLYPVWLYAIVPEVFGLFSLFSSVILYVFLLYIETKKIRWLYILSFLSGVSLTHHHLIVFLLFSIGITIFFQYKKLLSLSLVQYVSLLFFFLLGFSFYVYAPIVSSGYPPFDWEHPATLHGFIRLITRASFGTFKASYDTGQSLIDRFLNLLTFFQYGLKDIGIFLLFFFLPGLLFLWRYKRKLFYFFGLYIFLLVFFFFYAGFPVNSDFSLGTIERFFVVPYQVICICIGIGVSYGILLLSSLWKKYARSVHIPFYIIQTIIFCIFLTFFIRQFRIQYPKLILLRNDRTLEKLADDIFASVPEGGILTLQGDTPTFAVDYAYYVLRKRPDIQYILFPMFQFSYYQTWMKKNFPEIQIPKTTGKLLYKDFLEQFLQLNFSKRPIASERIDTVISEHWVPRGLVFLYYPTLDEIPDRGQILEKNVELWKRFQDPLHGVLGTYKHMMMTDILRYYADKRFTLAQSFLLYGNMEKAENEIDEAIRLYPNRAEVYIPYINLLLERKKCEKALEMTEEAFKYIVIEKDMLSIYHHIYELCEPLRTRLETKEQAYQNFMKLNGKRIE
jgi:hypothetical protein